MTRLLNKKGFTLVELAIVLVIIGIVLGAILKGTELINNSKAKRLQNDLKGVEAAMWTFYDRMGRMPGDCDRDGVIEYNLPTSPPTYSTATDPSSGLACGVAENQNTSWADMRVQRILPPNTPNADLARHPFGGTFAIGYTSTNINAIAVYNIPAWAAKMIDTSVDGTADGTIGRIRRFDTAGAWPTDANNDQQVSLIYYFDRTP